MPSKISFATLGLVLFSMGGCGFIAKDGPATGGIASQASQTKEADGDSSVPFVLIAAAPENIRAANGATTSLIPRFGALARGPGADINIGIGDILSIAIFEGDVGGLFVPKDGVARQGNYVQIPHQQVDSKGQIVIPYIEAPVAVAGRSTRAVGKEIATRLSSRAIDPQVVVTVEEKRGNAVSVLGDVKDPAKFSLEPGGSSLLAAIARAGGPKHQAHEEIVSLQRDGHLHRAWLSFIVDDPSQNISVRPGDVIFVNHEERIFMVLGATPTPGALGGQNNRRFPFGNKRISLSEALATAGGLDSQRADPQQIFLFRFEPKKALDQIGIDTSAFTAEYVPTAYVFDLSKGSTFFLTDAFDVRDKDIIFVTDAPATDLHKVLNLLNSVSQSGYYGSQIYRWVQ